MMLIKNNRLLTLPILLGMDTEDSAVEETEKLEVKTQSTLDGKDAEDPAVGEDHKKDE